jgi:hypothetical protein
MSDQAVDEVCGIRFDATPDEGDAPIPASA